MSETRKLRTHSFSALAGILTMKAVDAAVDVVRAQSYYDLNSVASGDIYRDSALQAISSMRARLDEMEDALKVEGVAI